MSSELDCCIEEVKISAFKSIDRFYEEYKEKLSTAKKPKKVRKVVKDKVRQMD